jgi:hypothetical protein
MIPPLVVHMTCSLRRARQAFAALLIEHLYTPQAAGMQERKPWGTRKQEVAVRERYRDPSPDRYARSPSPLGEGYEGYLALRDDAAREMPPHPPSSLRHPLPSARAKDEGSK